MFIWEVGQPAQVGSHFILADSPTWNENFPSEQVQLSQPGKLG